MVKNFFEAVQPGRPLTLDEIIQESGLRCFLGLKNMTPLKLSRQVAKSLRENFGREIEKEASGREREYAVAHKYKVAEANMIHCATSPPLYEVGRLNNFPCFSKVFYIYFFSFRNVM